MDRVGWEQAEEVEEAVAPSATRSCADGDTQRGRGCGDEEALRKPQQRGRVIASRQRSRGRLADVVTALDGSTPREHTSRERAHHKARGNLLLRPGPSTRTCLDSALAPHSDLLGPPRKAERRRRRVVRERKLRRVRRVEGGVGMDCGLMSDSTERQDELRAASDEERR